MLKYPAKWKKSKADHAECLFLEFIDIPDAFTQGLTMDELIENGRDVLSLTIKCMLEDNEEIPAPSKFEQHSNDILYIELYPEIAIPLMLKNLRIKTGKTQKEIAQRLGVSYQTYQKMERGKRVNPTLKTLERLAEVFGLRMILDFKQASKC